MKYNFDELVDRTNTYDKRWNIDYLKSLYKIDLKKPIFPFSLGDTDFMCPPKVIEKIKTRIQTSIFGYTYVDKNFYNKIILWNKKRFNLNITEEEILLSYGTIPALYSIIRALTKEGDSIIVNTPVYGPFQEAIIDNKRIIIKNKLEYINHTYKIDFKNFEKQIIDNQVKAYILCNPHNPGGLIWSVEEINTIVEICKKHNVIIISDEVHRDLIFENTIFTSLYSMIHKYKNIIVATSPNKAFNLGGLKTSYLIIYDKELREKVKSDFKIVRTTSPNNFGTIALEAAYDSEEWLNELNSYIENNFNFLKNEILKNNQKVSIFNTKSSFFLYINLEKYNLDYKKIKEKMEKNNIFICYGDDFIDETSTFARINIGCSMKLLKLFVPIFLKTLEELEC